MADLDGPGGAALAGDADLPAVQVKIVTRGVVRVVADARHLGQADAGRGEYRDDRGVAALGERAAAAGALEIR